jgi:hypothetical protein
MAVVQTAAVFCVPLGYAYLASVTAAALEPLGMVPDVRSVAWPRSPGDAQAGIDCPAWPSNCLGFEPLDFDGSSWSRIRRRAPDTPAAYRA